MNQNMKLLYENKFSNFDAVVWANIKVLRQNNDVFNTLQCIEYIMLLHKAPNAWSHELPVKAKPKQK